MTRDLTPIKVVPHFMRLHEWMALEYGYYQDEGLTPEHLDHVTHGLLSHQDKAYYDRPQDRPFIEGITVVNAACHWGSASNAGAGMGKFVPDLYGVANYSFFVRADSPFRSLLDLANVPIGIGARAGTHYTTLKAMEMIHPRGKIVLNDLGGPGKRLQALEAGEIDAINLVDPVIDMALQRGHRRLAMGQFRILFWVSEDLWTRRPSRHTSECSGEPMRNFEPTRRRISPCGKETSRQKCAAIMITPDSAWEN